jgi:uncharacterized protein involved in oxidation of intracellular sulfur
MGQTVPNGYYHLDGMLKSFVRKGGQIACCGTCVDARGRPRITSAKNSSMGDLAA